MGGAVHDRLQRFVPVVFHLSPTPWTAAGKNFGRHWSGLQYSDIPELDQAFFGAGKGDSASDKVNRQFT